MYSRPVNRCPVASRAGHRTRVRGRRVSRSAVRVGVWLTVAFLPSPVAAIMTENSPSPRQVVERYIRSANRHDVTAMLSCLADDFVFSAAGSAFRMTKHDLLPVLAWDAGLNGRARFRTLAASATSATVVVTERNDFYRLLGIGQQSYRARFTVRNGVMHEEVIEEMIKQGLTVAEALIPVVAWARLHRPEQLDGIYQDGQPIYDGESATRWVALLQAWRASTAPTPPG